MVSQQQAPIEISATKREQTGKGYARKLRKRGLIPAVLLEKGNSTNLELDPKLLSKAYNCEGRRFELKLDDNSTRTVTIKELQLDPVKRWAIHVDLQPLS